MTGDRQARVREIFEEALTVDTASRGALVERASDGDATLAREVMELLAANKQAGAFLDRLSIDAGGDPAAVNADGANTLRFAVSTDSTVVHVSEAREKPGTGSWVST